MLLKVIATKPLDSNRPAFVLLVSLQFTPALFPFPLGVLVLV